LLEISDSNLLVFPYWQKFPSCFNKNVTTSDLVAGHWRFLAHCSSVLLALDRSRRRGVN